jgi:hypothetical protein
MMISAMFLATGFALTLDKVCITYPTNAPVQVDSRYLPGATPTNDFVRRIVWPESALAMAGTWNAYLQRRLVGAMYGTGSAKFNFGGAYTNDDFTVTKLRDDRFLLAVFDKGVTAREDERASSLYLPGNNVYPAARRITSYYLERLAAALYGEGRGLVSEVPIGRLGTSSFRWACFGDYPAESGRLTVSDDCQLGVTSSLLVGEGAVMSAESGWVGTPIETGQDLWMGRWLPMIPTLTDGGGDTAIWRWLNEPQTEIVLEGVDAAARSELLRRCQERSFNYSVSQLVQRVSHGAPGTLPGSAGRRITVRDWAFANGFLAACDTVVNGSRAMPQLRYLSVRDEGDDVWRASATGRGVFAYTDEGGGSWRLVDVAYQPAEKSYERIVRPGVETNRMSSAYVAAVRANYRTASAGLLSLGITGEIASWIPQEELDYAYQALGAPTTGRAWIRVGASGHYLSVVFSVDGTPREYTYYQDVGKSLELNSVHLSSTVDSHAAVVRSSIIPFDDTLSGKGSQPCLFPHPLCHYVADVSQIDTTFFCSAHLSTNALAFGAGDIAAQVAFQAPSFRLLAGKPSTSAGGVNEAALIADETLRWHVDDLVAAQAGARASIEAILDGNKGDFDIVALMWQASANLQSSGRFSLMARFSADEDQLEMRFSPDGYQIIAPSSGQILGQIDIDIGLDGGAQGLLPMPKLQIKNATGRGAISGVSATRFNFPAMNLHH